MRRIEEIYQLFKTRKKVELGEVAKLLKISENSALFWAKALQQDKVLSIQEEDGKIYLILVSEAKIQAPSPKKVKLSRVVKPFVDAIMGKEKETISAEEVSSLTDDYAKKIADLKRKSDEIQEMEKTRTTIIYKDYIPLERRFEVELHLINQQLADKEERVKELEKRIREVPGKFEVIESHATKLEKMESYVRASIDKSKARIEREMARIKMLQGVVEKHIIEVGKRIAEQTTKLREIEKELFRLRKMEDWMYIQQSDLDKRMKDYARVRRESMKELDDLREIFRAGFLKKHSKELSRIKEKHEVEIYQIRKKEEELNEKIRIAKKDLFKITNDSKAIIERFEKITKRKVEIEKAHEELEEKKEFVKDVKTMPSTGIE
jgi:hypothetical protein